MERASRIVSGARRRLVDEAGRRTGLRPHLSRVVFSILPETPVTFPDEEVALASYPCYACLLASVVMAPSPSRAGQ